MYAIVQTGGKQYKVSEGETFEVEKLDAEVGSKINLDCLMIVDEKKVQTGKPLLTNVNVLAEVINHGKDKKITVFKYKAKKNVRKKQGHRQPFTTLKIVEIK